MTANCTHRITFEDDLKFCSSHSVPGSSTTAVVSKANEHDSLDTRLMGAEVCAVNRARRRSLVSACLGTSETDLSRREHQLCHAFSSPQKKILGRSQEGIPESVGSTCVLFHHYLGQ